MAMFEVGQRYEFRMLRDGEEWTSWGEVESIEGALIKLRDAHGIPGEIINTGSPSFVSATRRKEEPTSEDNRYSKFGFPDRR
ncbi:MAG: hypothetical protein K0Q54_2580 [Methylobacterium brachiatum]|jgi:hypothetical protein|nr:hypothetical protein [Methylobacterium brachiatum]